MTKFRLTSKDRAALEGAAKVYGGKPQPWNGHEGEWEVFTNADELAILVAPDPLSQWYELWGGGYIKRRCDGVTCAVHEPKGTREVECLCNPEDRECGIKTRASFILPDLPGLGRWRLDTGSFYAASELPGQIELLQMSRARGVFPEAVLAIETRTYKRMVEGSVKTFTPSIVTIRFRDTMRQLLGTEAPMIEDSWPDREHAIGPGAPNGPKAIEAAPEYGPDVKKALGEFVKLAKAKARVVNSYADAEELIYVLLGLCDEQDITLELIAQGIAELEKEA